MCLLNASHPYSLSHHVDLVDTEDRNAPCAKIDVRASVGNGCRKQR